MNPSSSFRQGSRLADGGIVIDNKADCFTSKDLAGLIDENKEASTKGLASMFATGLHVSNASEIEFDVVAEDSETGMTPAVEKCYLPPDIPDSAFYTKSYRPASYADSFTINNCERCPIRVPLEREYDFLSPDEKLIAHRIHALRTFERRRENRWEYDVSRIIENSAFWVRYQDEMGKETDRHFVRFPRHAALSGASVAVPWTDPSANIVCDLQQIIDIHEDIACRNVVKIILGANVAKCLQQSKQFNICKETACESDVMRFPSFSKNMRTPCSNMYDGLVDYGSYCEIDYFKYNAKIKGPDGVKRHILDPDCIYTVAVRPDQDPLTRMFSRFSRLTEGYVESEIMRVETYDERPDALTIDERYCGMPAPTIDNVFAKWRVKAPDPMMEAA